MNKKLYFLHIPKTGGMSIVNNIKDQLKENNVKSFIFHDEEYDGLNKYTYIQGHIGTYPINNLTNIDTISILRDPIERSVSTFLHLYPTVIFGRGLIYDKMNNIKDKLRYYLFEDVHYKDHYNLQSKFLCLNGEKDLINEIKPQSWQAVFKRSHRWNLEHGDFSFEKAKTTIDSMKMCTTIENHELLSNFIETWFLENYNIIIKIKKEKRFNESKIKYFENDYDTKTLISMLSDNEKSMIAKNNSIDFEIYHYLKNKQEKTNEFN